MEGTRTQPHGFGHGARHTSGLTSRLILNYVEREAGPRGVSALLEHCGLLDHEQALRNPVSWFDFWLKLSLLEAAAEVLGRSDAPRRIGQAAIELQSLHGLKLALRAFGTPALAYGAVPAVTGRFTRAHNLEVLELGERHASFRYSDVSGVGYHVADCQYTIGLLECVPTMFGALPARVDHDVCAARGSGECLHALAWEPYRSGLSSGARGLVSATKSVKRLKAAPQAVAAHRQRRRALEASIRDQEQVAARLSSSLRDLVSDLRTDQVLQKIIDHAQAALLDREVAVLVRSEEGVEVLGSHGLAAESLAALEVWAATHPDRLDEALDLVDLSRVPELSELAHHPTTPLGALLGAPLLYKGERLGAVMALAQGADVFLPKEAEVLEVFAAEAAIALSNARLVERLEEAAHRDSLTGLLNHGEFQQRLERELEGAQRTKAPLSLVMFDLDGFKQVNDEYGHAEGDRFLRAVAHKLRLACTGRTVAARVGGDEFVLLLPDRGAREAEALAVSLAQEVESLGFGAGASWGVAEWPTAGPTQSLLLFNADRAVYEAKLAKGKVSHRTSPAQTSDALSVGAPIKAGDSQRALTAALARAVDAKDSYTRSHCETVAELCTAIGQELGFDPHHLRKLRLAGLLHDVGKIGIADAILQKPDRLTDEEFEVMKTHATLGHSILNAAELFEESQWVLHHHERLDGHGYPDGLSADQIPHEARIILVADAFEAMTSDRPYRYARRESEALAELRRGAETQFDAEPIDVLAQLLARGPRALSGSIEIAAQR